MPKNMTAYKVHVIDVKNDLKNYIWLIEHTPSHEVVIIDPTNAELVLNYCHEQQLIPTQIWLTHWHKDHIGGVPALLAAQHMPVYGPRAELSKIPMINHPIDQDSHVHFHDLEVEIIEVPGHTLGHIVYYVENIDAAFVGDTLFSMGCGRVFEGTYEQMFHSLQRLAALPSHTQIYCTHEYTLANAKFALSVEPDNVALQQRADHVEHLRYLDKITLPSSIEQELATNPFLRASSVEDFQRLRTLKDHF